MDKLNKAIYELQEFLECDLYSKLRPKIIIGGDKMYRKDFIKTEEEFCEYLKVHFDILRKEIKKLKHKSFDKGKEALKRLRNRN